MTSRRSKKPYGSAVAAGLVAGLAASFAMNLAMRAIALATFETRTGEIAEMRRRRRHQRVREYIEMGDPNEEILDRTSRLCCGRAFPDEWKEQAATLAHYTFGTLLGAAYSLGVEAVPQITTGAGTVAALLWWATVNEGFLPASGLLRPWRETPRRMHAAMLVSHIVYGITLEETRRLF